MMPIRCLSLAPSPFRPPPIIAIYSPWSLFDDQSPPNPLSPRRLNVASSLSSDLVASNTPAADPRAVQLTPAIT
ncbi:unnamed protein product [Rhizoctonia solani]|uniref:Uncharacterized protein n=1 Tax=Rhizoctonia solani TaxID=456999 RepID=A0A8H2WT57_9AGAM|nr:unnamed protein product [Rhizoctonia solani]